ncbi:dTMP kinase [Anaerovorax odorimutans]|uniref:Thymidylate kinase n=1 Tax=Anaerovorax odorimutans TaxID=109327 RepID=A0ABT1RS46_9FIRM|nr:dTMP kinase [Anaerovorax odorimutans]MCQ4637990.1 dTMP kinase [Anaerovorax odorimutans]
MKNGLFITLEGPDGSGKSTQIERIRTFFQQRGEKVVLTREPGGTAISEKIRTIILDKENREMDAMTEALLYAASRAQHVAQVIRPALERGEHVICDRFIDSSIAYQGYGRGLGDCVSIINAYAVRDCIPDITFLLKLDPGIGKGRIGQEAQDRIEMEALDFHNRVFHGYEELELQFPDRIVGIDASGDIEEISREILGHIERLLKNEL